MVVDSPDLGVTHQALLEPNSQSVSLKLDKVVLVPDSIHVLSLSVEDCISLFVIGKSPSVVDARISSALAQSVIAFMGFTHIKQTFSGPGQQR